MSKNKVGDVVLVDFYCVYQAAPLIHGRKYVDTMELIIKSFNNDDTVTVFSEATNKAYTAHKQSELDSEAWLYVEINSNNVNAPGLVVLNIPCPVCGKFFSAASYPDTDYEFAYDQYDFEDAPIQVIAGVDNRHPFCCPKCKTIFKLETNYSAKIILIKKGRFANAY